MENRLRISYESAHFYESASHFKNSLLAGTSGQARRSGFRPDSREPLGLSPEPLGNPMAGVQGFLECGLGCSGKRESRSSMCFSRGARERNIALPGIPEFYVLLAEGPREEHSTPGNPGVLCASRGGARERNIALCVLQKPWSSMGLSRGCRERNIALCVLRESHIVGLSPVPKKSIKVENTKIVFPEVMSPMVQKSSANSAGIYNSATPKKYPRVCRDVREGPTFRIERL